MRLLSLVSFQFLLQSKNCSNHLFLNHLDKVSKTKNSELRYWYEHHRCPEKSLDFPNIDHYTCRVVGHHWDLTLTAYKVSQSLYLPQCSSQDLLLNKTPHKSRKYRQKIHSKPLIHLCILAHHYHCCLSPNG